MTQIILLRKKILSNMYISTIYLWFWIFITYPFYKSKLETFFYQSQFLS